MNTQHGTSFMIHQHASHTKNSRPSDLTKIAVLLLYTKLDEHRGAFS
jgi:hypothetical protein